MGDLWRYLVLWPRLALEMEDVWLQTRTRSPWETRVIEEAKRIPSSVRGWRRMRASELQHAYRRAARALRQAEPHPMPGARIAVPPRLWLWLQRWNPCAQSLTWSRASLERFWRRSAQILKRGRLHRLDISGLAFNGLQELTLFATFATVFFSRLLRRLLARTGFDSGVA